MAETERPTATNPDIPSSDLLAPFLAQVRELPGTMLKGSLPHAANDDERRLMDQLAGVFTAQINELTSYVEGLSRKAGSAQTADAQQFLRLAAAGPLASSGMSVAGDLASPVARIGLGGIIQEIKKILKVLVEIFNIHLPSWFWSLVNLIDEILNKFLGIGSPSTSRILSEAEQGFLAEMAGVVRLEAASRADQQGRVEEDH